LLRRRASLRIKKPPHWGGFHALLFGEQSSVTLHRLDVAHGDLAGTAVFLGIEGDFLTFDQAAHSGALERGSVDEHVLAAIIRLNEAKAFLIVVELYGALIHGEILSLIEVHLSPRRATARPEARVDVWEGLNVRLAFSEGDTARLSGQMSITLPTG
jgi:hypothetical protein